MDQKHQHSLLNSSNFNERKQTSVNYSQNKEFKDVQKQLVETFQTKQITVFENNWFKEYSDQDNLGRMPQSDEELQSLSLEQMNMEYLGLEQNSRMQSEDPEVILQAEMMKEQNPDIMISLINENHDDLFIKQNSEHSQSIVTEEKQILNKIKSRKLAKKKTNKKKQSKNKQKTKPINKKRKQCSSDTKNIPKNYGKQIIKFVHDQRQKMEKMLFEMNIAFTYEEINNFLQTKKNKMSKISDLRSLWIEDNNIYSYPIKIISEYFLRKHCPSWIFNSRIQNVLSPLKYRSRLRQALIKPQEFKNLKQ